MQPLDEEMLTNLAKEPAVIEGHSILNLDTAISDQYQRELNSSLIYELYITIIKLRDVKNIATKNGDETNQHLLLYDIKL